MYSVLLSFDIEEFDLPCEYGTAISDSDKFSIAAAGASAILDTVDGFKVPVTFFVTAAFARANPALFRRMAESGHEIASHGLNHTTFEPRHLEESRKILEDLSGRPVRGFRPARLAGIPPESVRAAGYTYESSLNPVWLPGRYNNFLKPLKPFRESCGLIQIPISAVPVLRIPLFWLSFKNFPLGIYLFLADRTAAATGFFSMYTHPWEYSSLSAEARWGVPAFLTRHAGHAMQKRLSALIARMVPTNQFMTCSEFVRENFPGKEIA